jgi:hypothetical protein
MHRNIGTHTRYLRTKHVERDRFEGLNAQTVLRCDGRDDCDNVHSHRCAGFHIALYTSSSGRVRPANGENAAQFVLPPRHAASDP